MRSQRNIRNAFQNHPRTDDGSPGIHAHALATEMKWQPDLNIISTAIDLYDIHNTQIVVNGIAFSPCSGLPIAHTASSPALTVCLVAVTGRWEPLTVPPFTVSMSTRTHRHHCAYCAGESQLSIFKRSAAGEDVETSCPDEQ